ncbi:MAG: FAD:protein FMN transferase, partial [Mariprofundaceae bacterium]|nr:FAD:protein FMN transferase [Mariprofundaceae bacterium]
MPNSLALHRRLTMCWICTVIAITTMLSACTPPPQETQETRFMMGTIVVFTVMSNDEAAAQQAISTAASAMQAIEQQMTIYGEHHNAVKRFNRSAPGQAVTLPPALDGLLRQAMMVSQASNHAFSPALGALDLLWGFSSPQPLQQPPADAAIQALIAKPLTGCLVRGDDHRWLRSYAACMLDLGGIAKGYALDQGMAVLQQHGMVNAMINAGGDIRLSGLHGERPWRIGIRDPQRQGSVVGVLELSGNQSVVTSGDYERFFIWHGTRYHHILDPHRGYPAMVAHSSTIIAPTATLADAWSTALFVAGSSLLPT